MKNRRGIIFFWTGIVLTIILIFIIANMKTDIADLAGANNNSENPSVQKEQNMSEALDQQKRKLIGIIDSGSYIPGNFRNYDIIYFKKLNNERYEVEILGALEDVNVVHEELYKFNISTSELKSNENMDIILNMTKNSLNGLLAKREDLPEKLNEYNIVYYRDYGQGEYEFGIEADGALYYFLLENNGLTRLEKWSLLGWSEGSVPDDWNGWNDILAVQKYASTGHSSLSEQEYEVFFTDYVKNIYRLIDEYSKLKNDVEKYNGKSFDNIHYKLLSANSISLFDEAEKAMKISLEGKYKDTHTWLVKAMYGVSRITDDYVKGNEGYIDYPGYDNWTYRSRVSQAKDLINIAYACFEAEKQNQVFDEKKYNEIEYNNRVEITRLIDKQIYKYTNFTLRYARNGVVRVNNTQYKYHSDEGSATNKKGYTYTFEKGKDGKWMIVDKTEI